MTPAPEVPPLQLLALHGWAGDQRCWQPWGAQAQRRGWSLVAAERGYGQLPPSQPGWDPRVQRRIVLGHSLGPHLLAPSLWESATGAVLLASFAAFVPEGRAGRPVRTALRGMAAQLNGGQAEAMLEQFMQRVAAPFPREQLPNGPLEQGIGPEGLQRLQADLELLDATAGLPQGWPEQLPVLIVEAEDDAIVAAASRERLKQLLPHASVWTLPRAGHGLLGSNLSTAVLEFLADGLP